MKKRTALLTLVIAALAMSSLAQIAPVLKPGSDNTESGVEFDVTGRFVDHGDSTITDALTGLMWQQTPTSSTVTWTAAISYCEGLSLGGHTDWRLPNVNELATLVNYSSADPEVWLNANGFTGVESKYYWSSTTYASDTSSAWVVSMSSGSVNGYEKALSFQVWAVRGPE